MRKDRYLLRFDDICPTMNWAIWDKVEEGLCRHGVRPILAVVPDNHDPKLIVCPPRPDFWDRVRQWQLRGWAIGLHGYQHRYVNNSRGLMKLTPQSEFACLPRVEQEAKLRAGLAIFAEQNVRADCWVAPAHSFDLTTVAVLAEMGLRTISDGLEQWPYRDAFGVTWIPQQLWSFRRKGAGVWTVCQHHNDWTEAQCDSFLRDLQVFAPFISDLPTVVGAHSSRSRSVRDRAVANVDLLWNHRLRGPVAKAIRRVIRR